MLFDDVIRLISSYSIIVFNMVKISGFAIFILKKVLIYTVTLFLAFTLVFWVLRLIPGDPWSRFVDNLRILAIDPQISREFIEGYKRKFGLDKDIFTQYILYLSNLFLRFDLGISIASYPTPVQVVIMRSLPWSIGLLAICVLISWSIGIVAGAFIGWKHRSKLSSAMFTIALGMSQIPYFIMAILLIMILAYGFGLFPGRWAFSPSVTPGLNPAFILSVIRHGFLPALSIVVTSFLGWLVSTRALTMTILGEDYLLFAEAKGLKKIRMLNRYVLRNLLLPQATGLAISLGYVVNGAYVVEYIFQYPGVGTLLIHSFRFLDYNLAQGIIFVTMFTVLTANLIMDFLYPLIDPRVRTQGK